MIARILDGHGIGVAMAAIIYIAGKLNHKGQPRDEVVHLFGDGQLVIDVTEAMSCKHRYLSSVLSFTKEESKHLTVDQVRSLAESFAEHHANPFGTNNIAGCAYLHIEDSRYDVHLVQAQYDFESGKRVDLYLDQFGDSKRIGDWQDIHNFEYDLDDPRDPARQRLTKEIIQEAPNRKEMRSLVNTSLERMHINGEIGSRKDVCKELESLGFVIARQTKSSISISSPDLNQNIRLTGAIYHESYAGIEDSRRAIEESQRRTHEDRQKQYDTAKERLVQSNQKRTARLSKKLGTDFASRVFEPQEIAGVERYDALGIGDHEHRIAHDNHPDVDPEPNYSSQISPSCTDRVSDADISGPYLRDSSSEQYSEDQGWPVHGQGEVNDGSAASHHKVTDLVSPHGRDHGHEERMRRLSDCSRALERAGQRFGRACDLDRSTVPTAREGVIAAIEQFTTFVAKLTARLRKTLGGGNNPA